MEALIYILSAEIEYSDALATGYLHRDSIEEEGFIHASPRDQLNRVGNKYYREAEGLRVLVIQQDLVKPGLKWESAAGSLYPHIYGPLNMDAIVKVVAVPPAVEGETLDIEALLF